MSLEPKVLLQKLIQVNTTAQNEVSEEETEEKGALIPVEVTLVGGGGDDSGDVMLLNGKEINIATDPSDSAIEAMIQATSGEPFVNYKSLADAVVASIKQQIWNIHHPGTTPGGGEDPVDPEDPEDPEDPGDEGEEAEVPSTVDYTLLRKDATMYTKTITVGTTATTVELGNTIDGKRYYYTLTSTDSSSHSVTLTYLDNGRLVIQGDHIKIVATKDQDDDIVLIGDYCEVYTNSGDDKVRVGTIKDSDESDYLRSKDYGGGPEDTTQSDYNYINLGSGDDYVEIFGGLNDIVGGAGNDKMLLCGVTLEKMSTLMGITTDSIEFLCSEREALESTLDGVYSGGGQGGYGDCKFLSTLNSIMDNWSEYIKITKSGSNYKVTFLKSGTTQTVTPSDLAAVTEPVNGESVQYAYGDMDLRVVEAAFKLLITADGYHMFNDAYTGESLTAAQQEFNSKTLGSSFNNFLISKYLFGVDTSAYHSCYFLVNSAGSDNLARILLDALNAGEISNFVVGTNDSKSGKPENRDLGIYYNHAYAVKGGVAGKYVLLCNPWDSNDIIQLDWSDFLLYYSSVNLFGDTWQWCIDKGHINASPISSSSAEEQYYEEIEVANVDTYNIFAEETEELKKLVKE